MYFLIGEEFVDNFVRKALNSWSWGTPLVLFFMFCGSQVSIETKNWEIRMELAKFTDKKIT